MIELTFVTAFMLYLGSTLALILGIWGFSHYQTKNKQIMSLEKSLSTCEYCHFAYLNDSAKKITQCPQCGSYNRKSKISDKKL